MAKNKNKARIWLFVILALVLAGCAMLGVWYVNWWGLVLPWQVLTISAGMLSLACLLSCLLYILYLKLTPAKLDTQQQTERERLKYVRRQLLQRFQAACRSSKVGSDSYATPWYLMLNQTSENNTQLLIEMGFELLAEDSDTELPSVVEFWVSEFAVIAAIGRFDSDYFDESVELLLNCLHKYRPRQGANGVLISESVSWLLQQQHPQIAAQTKQVRKLIARCNQALRLNLPIYNVLTDFSAVSDLQRLFSCFDDQRLEEPLGGLMEVAKQGYDEAWFVQSFNDIQSQLFLQTTSGLKAQLNNQYRESILVGPYQFALIKTELQQYFRLLYSDHHFEENSLNFRGYFFTNSGSDQRSVDKLSLLLASELGYEQYSQTSNESGKSLFNKQLFKGKIISEAGLVGVNTRRENSYRFIAVLFSSSLLLSLAIFIGLIKYNYDFFRGLDARAQLKLEKYQDDLQRSNENIDDLSVPIYRLSELRDIRNIYTDQRPWYIVTWLPNPSIQQAVELSYQQGLEQLLLPALRDYLLKDMFVYNQLEDKLKTIELYNLYKRLYDPQRLSIEVLEKYYSDSLKEEGEGDPATLEKFRILLAEGLRPGITPPEDHQPLIGIVKASLSSEDVSEILYQYILQRPSFSRRVDLRDSLGHRANFLLNYSKDYSGYLMPFIYTRDGFEQLMLGGEFQLAIDEIKGFEEVVEKITSQSQLSRINQELKQLYIEDYISVWLAFYSSINLSAAEGTTQIRDSLTLMGDVKVSPLLKLQQLISRHTNLLDLLESPKQTTADAAENALSTDPQKLKLLQETQATALKMAKTIARPFAGQHQLMKPDDQGVRPIDIALGQIRESLEWIDTALEQGPRGSSLLQQLSAGTGANPLLRMQDLAASFSDKLLSNYLADSARQLNRIAMSEVRAFINLQWQKNVLSFYQNRLANHYPFASQSLQDASREAFEDFFAVNGTVDQFKSDYLGDFTHSEGQLSLVSFIDSEPMILNSKLNNFLTKVRDIQRRLYSAGELKIEFSIRAEDMSPGFLEIALQQERKIYSYRNGPSIWSPMSWPTAPGSTQSLELELKTVDNHFLRVSFVGFWNWFKLADTLGAVPLEQPSNSLLSLENKGEKVKLLLRVNGGKTPFLSGYFSSLRLPSEL
ncbi:hypothetical protein A9R01_06790 ['Osedax' symbiont bacterium Rs2_46_30_T18]|nr:hypothetical protein A9R01_06790 ['Osedax' symbiont bacterium Rs2_46_30_T18]